MVVAVVAVEVEVNLLANGGYSHKSQKAGKFSIFFIQKLKGINEFNIMLYLYT